MKLKCIAEKCNTLEKKKGEVFTESDVKLESLFVFYPDSLSNCDTVPNRMECSSMLLSTPQKERATAHFPKIHVGELNFIIRKLWISSFA